MTDLDAPEPIEMPEASEVIEVVDAPAEVQEVSEEVAEPATDQPPAPSDPGDTPDPEQPNPDDVTPHTRPGGPETLPLGEGEPLEAPHTPEKPSPSWGGPERGGW